MVSTSYNPEKDYIATSERINKIDMHDLAMSLKSGWSDFMAKPSHLAFLVLIYPIVGFVLIRFSANMNLIPLIYPLLTGLALVGPVAALGLYEISRRREKGETPHWRHVFTILKSPALGAVLTLGGVLLATFFFWLITAMAIYRWILGDYEPQSMAELLTFALTTRDGWLLIVLGNGAGFLFAAFVLSISIVTFPLLLDRDGPLRNAVRMSLLAVKHNPVTLLIWGFIIAVGIAIGLVTFLVGLMITLPVLGHASWHLYRRLVS